MATTEQGTTPESPAEKETKAAERTYVVLARDESRAGTWLEMGSVIASTDYQAITLLTGEDEPGTWVAIPERNWHPRKRELEPRPPKPVWS